MGKNQRAPDFGCDTAFLEEDEKLYLAYVMSKNGAKHSGCLLLQAPLWVLFILAVVACLLICAASQAARPPAALSMLAFGGLVPIGVEIARRWVMRVYYRRLVVIGE